MESVAIGTDGVRTRLALLHQALSKETLQQCRQTDAGSAHGRSSQRCCSRSIASRISSGEPSKYHCVSATCTWPRWWTTAAVVFRDPDQTGTIARGYLSRNGGACRADEGPDRRICLADRSAETTHRRSDECLPHPNDCPSWRRINRRTPLALPNVADVWRCSLQAPCRSMHAKAPSESCRTWCRESSTPPPSDRHLEARGCVLHRGVDPKRSAVRIDSNKPTAATYRVQSDRA